MTQHISRHLWIVNPGTVSESDCLGSIDLDFPHVSIPDDGEQSGEQGSSLPAKRGVLGVPDYNSLRNEINVKNADIDDDDSALAFSIAWNVIELHPMDSIRHDIRFSFWTVIVYRLICRDLYNGELSLTVQAQSDLLQECRENVLQAWGQYQSYEARYKELHREQHNGGMIE